MKSIPNLMVKRFPNSYDTRFLCLPGHVSDMNNNRSFSCMNLSKSFQMKELIENLRIVIINPIARDRHWKRIHIFAPELKCVNHQEKTAGNHH